VLAIFNYAKEAHVPLDSRSLSVCLSNDRQIYLHKELTSHPHKQDRTTLKFATKIWRFAFYKHAISMIKVTIFYHYRGGRAREMRQ
jgi:hypothetical protein